MGKRVFEKVESSHSEIRQTLGGMTKKKGVRSFSPIYLSTRQKVKPPWAQQINGEETIRRVKH